MTSHGFGNVRCINIGIVDQPGFQLSRYLVQPENHIRIFFAMSPAAKGQIILPKL